MDATSSNGVESFKTFTGCQDDAEARQLIEACSGNIEAAVDLFFQQKASSSNGCSEPSTSRHRIAHHPKSNQYNLRRSTRSSSNPSFSKKDQDDVVMIDEDYVRPPMKSVRGAIVEQSFQEQYQRPRRIQTNSVFESFRDYHPDQEQSSSGRGLNGVAARRSALQNLFKPPYDILFSGSWEEARAEAQRLSLWLLVNVQNVQEFACQALNRDVWSNISVKEIIKSNFVFWQVYHDSADGVRVGNYYRVLSYPAIFAIDPRTGELIENFRAVDPVAFCDQIGTFLSANPDFATRDHRITSAAASLNANNSERSRSSNEVTVVVARQYRTDFIMQIFKDEDMPQCSSGAGRKRPFRAEEVTSSQAQEEVFKKARKGIWFVCLMASDLDVDEILDRGNRLTTVDSDEWLKHLGYPDGKGQTLSIVLKFPDGLRKRIDVEDTTTLKAVFLLAAGLGYGQHDHMLTLFYPKREYLFENAEHTMRELGFNQQEVIHVERK
ncbi:unnamed protein product [Enterobius vermicularis]|uniref:UBX domain-containing protein n=1 Tax=Enterobius vermicularis TaxID=51028 RepID=A0A0N4V9Z8_ENTVE|nr:unnamed protein product [Enterobius vermicularis]